MKCLSIFLFLGIILTIVVAFPSKRTEELSNRDDIEAELKENARSSDAMHASESDEYEDDIEEVLAQDEDGDDEVATLALIRSTRCYWHFCSFRLSGLSCRKVRKLSCRPWF